MLAVLEALAVVVRVLLVLAQTELQTLAVAVVEAMGQTMALLVARVLLLSSGDFNNGLLC
jgi:hypothetical protein